MIEDDMLFDIIMIVALAIITWRLSTVSNRLEMNIMVVQSLQAKIDQIEKTK
jgi:hypothetical protein